MALTLLVGPANAGKVAALLERYLADIAREPYLIVPNASDIDRVERELLGRAGCLLGGGIGTFDDLFSSIAADGGCAPEVGEAQRALILRRVVAGASLNGLGASARFSGFAEELARTLGELESGLVDPDRLDGDLRELYSRYRAELARLGLSDRDARRRYAAERVASDLGAWDGRPVLAYGFEDLTGAQWRLLEALAARGDVTVSLPYEPGRAAFAALEATAAKLARIAGAVEELPPRYAEVAHPALAHLERTLFEAVPADPPPLEGAVRFVEAAGTRATLETVAAEILDLVESGTPAEEILVVCPTLERIRAPLETAFGAFGVTYTVEGEMRLAQTPYGHALVSLLRFAWLGGGRRELFAFVRSPYSGLARAHADFVEGRLRGRAVRTPARVEELCEKLRGAPFPFLERLRSAPSTLAAARTLAESMLRAAYGLEAPPATEAARLDLRAFEATVKLLDELDGWVEGGGELSSEELVAAIERTPARLGAAGREGRVAVVDPLRARTRRVDVVFVLGLEEGVFPRRSDASPFLDEDARGALDLVRPDRLARDRFLFYTACTRPARRLYLVREAATDDGAPRQPSPFWDEARAAFAADDVARWTRRRPLSQLVWPVDAAPTERERLRGITWLSTTDDVGAKSLAAANGWERRLARARAALQRRTELRHPAVLAELRERAMFGVTELEAFADCSSIWFVERLVDPRSIDGEVDARLRGQIAHQALFKFFSGLPKELGIEGVTAERIDDALRWLRTCLDDALAGYVSPERLELTDLERRELEQGLWRDLEAVVRQEADAASPLVPRKFEVSFGSERSAPELQRGLDLGGFAVSGKIDRIDADPFGARGVVHDYKSGKTAHSAVQIESEMRLQIPLYMLVLRDLVGLEPLGGLYRPLAGDRRARGLLRQDAGDVLRNFFKTDYLPKDEFWAQVERARDTARSLVERMRAGDVKHDPRGDGTCHQWCELYSMCRVGRA